MTFGIDWQATVETMRFGASQRLEQLDVQEFFVAVKMQQLRCSAVLQSTRRHDVQAIGSRDMVVDKLLTDDEIVALFRLIDSRGDGLVTSQMVIAFLEGGTSAQAAGGSTADKPQTDCKLGLEAFSQAMRRLAFSTGDQLADGETEALFAAIDSGGKGCISAQDFIVFLGGASLRSALDKLRVQASDAPNGP